VSIGEALADARLHAGLTVAQVSDQVRIREMIITGIEDDDYSVCGGDLYARGYIRIIARAVQADPGPLIREYNMAIADGKSEPLTGRKRRRVHWVTLLVLVWLGVAAYDLHGGLPRAASAAPLAQAQPVTHRPAAHATYVPSAPKRSGVGAVPARTLTPVSAAAFGPSGTGQGDAPQLAPLAIDGHPATAWHTDWYATASFGGLYAGTGLLLDMGRTVTIMAARITLGPDQAASFQLRVGDAPLLAALASAVQAVDTSGVVDLRLTAPAHGRYVLIWFTRLPRDPAGTFQASVYDIRLEGQP
jgi:hypothetical protein